MVNKAIVGILVLIVLTSLGVGVLIGTQLGGSEAPADESSSDGGTADGGDGGDSTTAAADGTAANGTTTNGTAVNATETATVTASSTPTPTPTATPAPTATPTPTRTTIPSYNFSTSQIEQEMIAGINERRSSSGLHQFETDTSTWRDVRSMTRIHSQAMANQRRSSFRTDAYADASERYRGEGVFDRCKYQDADRGYIVTPSNSFQAVGDTWAGQEYEDGGETRFNGDESQVAEAILEDWYSSSTYRRPLVNDDENVELIAVGVSITDDGRVFASAAICS